jgi:chemotaxis protein CheD
LTAFLGDLFEQGATRPYLDIKLVGGAKSLKTPSEFFNIGERNLILAKRFLWKNGLIVSRENTGGNDYRTLSLEMAGGRVFIKDPRGVFEL